MAAFTINDVRMSYCNLFQPKAPMNVPGGEPKYSVTILIPKSNTQAKAILDAEMAKAVEAGVASKWGGVRPPQPALPIHDGDGVRPSDGMPYGAECKGMWIITASSTRQPFVVDRRRQNILDATQVYSGMWGNVCISLYPYFQAGKRGVGCSLEGVQKVRDDTPLVNRITAQEAFSVIPEEPVSAAAAAFAGFN